MNILLTSATGYPSPDTGGPNKIIYYLLKGIKNHRNNVGYISKHYQLELNQYFTPRSVDYVNKLRNNLYVNAAFYRNIVTHPIYLQLHFKKLAKYFHSKINSLSNYDCLNSHDTVSSYFLRKYEGKKILTIHSKGAMSEELKDTIHSESSIGQSIINKIREMERMAFNAASYITFPSIAGKNMFLEAIDSDDTNKIKVIYNGIDLIGISQIEKSEKILDKYKIPRRYTHYILNVANHIKTKNIDKIIIAIELLVKKYRIDVCLINIGIGHLTVDLIKMIHHLGLDRNIFLLGAIPNEDVLKLMKICDYFIMTSNKVVFDMVILEALASRSIVLANHSGGNKEIIVDSMNGYFLYDNEPEEIAQKIISADMKVINGAIDTIKSFSLESMTEKYIELYSI